MMVTPVVSAVGEDGSANVGAFVYERRGIAVDVSVDGKAVRGFRSVSANVAAHYEERARDLRYARFYDDASVLNDERVARVLVSVDEISGNAERSVFHYDGLRFRKLEIGCRRTYLKFVGGKNPHAVVVSHLRKRVEIAFAPDFEISRILAGRKRVEGAELRFVGFHRNCGGRGGRREVAAFLEITRNDGRGSEVSFFRFSRNVSAMVLTSYPVARARYALPQTVFDTALCYADEKIFLKESDSDEEFSGRGIAIRFPLRQGAKFFP